MVNVSLNWLKASLALGVKNPDSLIAPIFGARVLDRGKFLIISLILLPIPPKTSILSVLNVFGANFLDDPVVFNIEVSGAAILLKPWMKRQ